VNFKSHAASCTNHEDFLFSNKRLRSKPQDSKFLDIQHYHFLYTQTDTEDQHRNEKCVNKIAITTSNVTTSSRTIIPDAMLFGHARTIHFAFLRLGVFATFREGWTIEIDIYLGYARLVKA